MTATGGTVKNEIQWGYLDNLGVNISDQDHNDAVDANTPDVQYTYDTSGVITNGLRQYILTMGYDTRIPVAVIRIAVVTKGSAELVVDTVPHL